MSLCEMLTPERREMLARALVMLGHGELVPLVETVHRAICGDTMSTMLVQQAAQESCSCKGKRAPQNFAQLVAQQANQMGASYRPVPQGQSGFEPTPGGPGKLPADWNCRISTGDLAECQLRELAADPYPILAVTPTVLAKPAPGLPVEPAGHTWVEIVIPAIDVSSELCIESFTLNTNVPAAIVPVRFALQGEKIAYDDAEGIVHVWDYPVFTARSGWDITPERCRCLAPPCVCLPAQARVRFAALITDAEAAAIGAGTLELFRDPNKLGKVVCGPCPPDDRCGRVILERCVCNTATPVE